VVVANAENVRNVLEDSVRKPKEKMRLSVEVGLGETCDGKVPKCPKRVIGIASLVRYAVVASSMEQLMAIADSVVVEEVCEIGGN
jgi:hypothetical protein